MQREIKFRAWDSGNKCMIRFDDFWVSIEYRSICFSAVRDDLTEEGKDLPGAYGTGANPESNGAYILMQFTGLHDKNGKEIYEGDKVKGRYFIQRSFDPDASPAIEYFEGVISFAEGFFYVKGEHNQCSFSFTYPDYEMELIGNIYENHELIA
jgi:uncharacterized phage protein (TIGR01671 family)